MMKTEDFFIEVDGQQHEIKTALPVGPQNVDHEVWKGDELLFTLHPHLNECDEPCWSLKREFANSNLDKELVQQIGEKIEMHYV